jgi:aminopeptidase N
MSETRKKFYLKDYKAPNFWQDKVDLTFKLFPTHTEVAARSHFVRNSSSGDTSRSVRLDGTKLELMSLKLNGMKFENYTLSEEGLTLNEVPEEFELEVLTKIYPEANKSMEGLYLSNGLYCTQCEAHGFRKITYFTDRPDNMAIFSVRIEADKAKYPYLLSNGNLLRTGDLPEARHFAEWRDPFRKPCYLFALVAGDLDCIEDSFRTRSGRNVTLKVYANKGRKERCWHAMNSLKWSFKWDEERYGLEYDLDLFQIVAVDDFNMGAMENKGLNIYNSAAALADVKTADDETHFRITSIVGHEYFHNWSGNRVTCRDWFQLSLKEGLTVYRDQEFTADLFSRPVQRLSDVSGLRETQFNEDAGPNAHPVRPDSAYSIDNFYTSTIYDKGAELIRMMETLLGTAKFEEGLKQYFKMFDGQAVTTDDFVKAMELVSGEDLTHFKKWYAQSGTPRVTVSSEYNSASKEYRLHFKQETLPTPNQSSKEPLLIPVKVGLLGKNGEDIIDPNTLLRLSKAEQSFTFKNILEKPTPSLFRDFSAPVKYFYEYSMDDLIFLMQKDSNRFNRWEAAQRVLSDAVLKTYEAKLQGGTCRLDSRVFVAMESNLADADMDPNFVSYMIQTPSYGSLVTDLKDLDPIVLSESLEEIQTQIGLALEKSLLAAFQKYCARDNFEITPRAMGERRLARVALAALCATAKKEHLQLALQYFKHFSMEAKTAALSALQRSGSEESRWALEDFYKQFANDELLFDDWIAYVIADARTNVSETLHKVLADAHFKKTNPNNNRSVWHGFQSNPAGFHQKDGSIYKVLADKIIELDAFNEQLAARLSKNLSDWKKYRAPYSTLMKQELTRILETPKLSPNTFEIVSDALRS